MIIRKLLINIEPKSEEHRILKNLYLKRINEMFLRSISKKTIFNDVDEILHGLARTAFVNQD